MHRSDSVDDGYLGSGKYLLRAVKKHGKENFIREILCFCKTAEEAFKNEAVFIKEYNTMSPRGYNVSPTGGLGMPGCFSKESKKKIGRATKGLIPWSKGLTKETDERIKNMSGDRSPNRRAVIQYSLSGDYIKKWECVATAGNELNICPPSISNCAYGKISVAGGYVWGLPNPSDEVKERYRVMKKKRETGSLSLKAILQYSLTGQFIKKWESSAATQRGLGICSAAVRECVNKKTKTSGGFIWVSEREDGDMGGADKEVVAIVKGRKNHGYSLNKSVIQYTIDGRFVKIWSGAAEAGRAIGIRNGGIGDCANGKLKTSGGYIWMFKGKINVEEINKKVRVMVGDRKGKGNHLSKTIIQYTTDGVAVREWNGAMEAQKKLGFLQSGISTCARGKCNTAYGFVWKFKERKK